jgi:hypothetical protein
MRILSNGNVGVGTTTPTSTLDVRKNASGYVGAFYNTSATGEGVAIRGGNTSSQNSLVVQNYDGNRAILIARSDGNVGIGTTTPTNNLNVVGNRAIIQVEDSTPVALDLSGTGGQISFGGQYRNAGDNVVGAYIKASKTNGAIGDYGHDLVFANITYPTTLTEKMIIKSNGRVGIGTTTPETRLDVVGNSIQCSNQGRFKGWYSGGQGSGLATEIGISSSEGFLIAYDRTANTYAPLNLGTNIKLLTNGNVGIGTATPSLSLDVSGGSIGNSSGNLTLNVNSTGAGGSLRLAGGTGLLSGSAGGNSGQHLVITINGTSYKIKLENV